MSDFPVFPAALVAFAVTVALVVALRPVAVTLDLVDKPGGRKRHSGEIPIIGGIAMFIGFLTGLVVLGIANQFIAGIIASLSLLIIVGVIDDATGVPPFVRVLIQVITICTTVFSAHLMIYGLGDPFGVGEIGLGPFALACTLVVGLTVVNAYNLVDGADGLAGVLALIAFAAVALIGGPGSELGMLSLVLGGAVVGYLVFNFPLQVNRRIRTFMGDAGSTLIGFMVFWMVLGISQGESRLISPVAGLWLASIPVYDLLTCFVRRLLRKKSPFTPGRDHFHHTLRRGGLNGLQKLAVLGGLQLVYAFVGVGASIIGVPDYAIFTLWSILGLTQFAVIKAIASRHRLHRFSKVRSTDRALARTV